MARIRTRVVPLAEQEAVGAICKSPAVKDMNHIPHLHAVWPGDGRDSSPDMLVTSFIAPNLVGAVGSGSACWRPSLGHASFKSMLY